MHDDTNTRRSRNGMREYPVHHVASNNSGFTLYPPVPFVKDATAQMTTKREQDLARVLELIRAAPEGLRGSAIVVAFTGEQARRSMPLPAYLVSLLDTLEQRNKVIAVMHRNGLSIVYRAIRWNAGDDAAQRGDGR